MTKALVSLLKDLVEKVAAWWDEVYPEDIFPVESADIQDRDPGAVKVAEIRKLLDKIKAVEEQSKGLDNE